MNADLLLEGPPLRQHRPRFGDDKGSVFFADSICPSVNKVGNHTTGRHHTRPPDLLPHILIFEDEASKLLFEPVSFSNGYPDCLVTPSVSNVLPVCRNCSAERDNPAKERAKPHPAAPINSRPISIRLISFVPAPISSSLASRM